MRLAILVLSFLIIGVIESTNSKAHAALSRFQTARLNQTAGTGVASLLINESTILNPAAITFFKDSTFYYQRTTNELSEKDSSRVSELKEGLTEFYSISDTTTALKGSFSYLYKNDAAGKNKRIALSSAAPIGRSTALGFILSHNEEESAVKDDDYTQIDVGLIHNISEKLILGFVYIDPQRLVPEYSYYAIGAQFTFNEFFTLMGDVGSGDVANPEKTGFSRAAFQISATKGLFLRYGISHDKLTGLESVGYGLSWVGPKFAIELATKNSESIPGNRDKYLEGEVFTTTSFGLTAFFN